MNNLLEKQRELELKEKGLKIAESIVDLSKDVDVPKYKYELQRMAAKIISGREILPPYKEDNTVEERYIDDEEREFRKTLYSIEASSKILEDIYGIILSPKDLDDFLESYNLKISEYGGYIFENLFYIDEPLKHWLCNGKALDKIAKIVEEDYVPTNERHI